ncbi:MAG: helix-turn-helix domain-containing protein [Bacteroides nordii]
MEEKNKPLELALDLLKHTTLVRNNEYRYITPDFGIVISFAGLDSYLFRQGQPYRTKEGRIIRALRGRARISINLIEYDVFPEMIIVTPPDSIIQVMSFSSDYDFQVIVASNNFLPIPHREDLTGSYMKQGIVTKLADKEWNETGMYFSLIWETVQDPAFRKEVVQYLLTALLYNIRYIQKKNQSNISQLPSHQEELFRRFIALVNEYNKKERTVSFYADKLCLTPRYLNTVIRQASQQTVMEWINQAVTLEAQVLLKHSNLMVYQIADELNFPNPSFFCKFFKRRTGMTPQEYQKK